MKCHELFDDVMLVDVMLVLTLFVLVAVPPTTLIMFDASGRDVTDGVVGPLLDGSDLILKCEVRGGKLTIL